MLLPVTHLGQLAVHLTLGQGNFDGQHLEMSLPQRCLGLQLLAVTLGRPHNPAIRYPANSGPIKVPGINHDSPDFTISTEVGDHIQSGYTHSVGFLNPSSIHHTTTHSSCIYLENP
jgi:hypothetical protein